MKRYYNFVFCIGLISFLFLACNQSEQGEMQANGKTRETAKPATGELTYVAQEGWVQQPPSGQMRKDQYVLPGAEGKEDGEMVVYHFPEMGGMIEANLNRWYGQFKQPDGSDTAAKAETETKTVNGIKITRVFTTGTFMKPARPMDMTGPKEEMPGYALLAVIAETGKGPWFFKATGPEETLVHWQPSFDKFIQTLELK